MYTRGGRSRSVFCFVVLSRFPDLLTVGQFVEGLIEKGNDSYLDELQEALSDRCGTHVSLKTIWRTLRRAGFTMKKVGINEFCQWFAEHQFLR